MNRRDEETITSDTEIGELALIVAFAAGCSQVEAAERAGVHRSTAARRWAGPTFRREVERTRSEMMRRAAGHLADGAVEAAQTLRSLLDSSHPPTVRLGAARSILELSIRTLEAVELERRIAALEDAGELG